MSRRRRAARKKNSSGQVIIRILLGAAIAIAFGIILGKLYHGWILVQGSETGLAVGNVSPGETSVSEQETEAPDPGMPNNSASQQGQDNGLISTQMPALRLFRVQAGAFSEEENATNFLAQLEAEYEYKGLITTGDGFYRVSVGAMATSLGAGELAEQLAKDEEIFSEEPIVIPEVLAGIKIEHAQEDRTYWQQLPDILESAVVIGQEMESLWSIYAAGGKAEEQVLNELAAVEELAGKLTLRIKSLPVPSVCVSLQSNLEVLADDIINSLARFRIQVENKEIGRYPGTTLTELINIWQQL
ncbi:MAG: SPOR domain-containing protein [bacterium]